MKVFRTQTVRPDMGVLDVKLKRAEKHISDLTIAIAAFHKEHRDFIGRKIDTNGNQVVYVKYVPEIPIMISAIVGDVLQNIRSTLDHLAYRIVISNPLTTSRKNIFFPCGESEEEYMASERRRVIEQASGKAIKRIDALKPYKGGNDTLWHLIRLNNIDKHRLLLTTAMKYKYRTATKLDYWRMCATIGKGNDPGGILSLIRHTNFDGPIEPLKVGDVIYIKPRVVDLKGEMKFSFEVAINEPQVMQCESLVETLYKMFKFVEGVIPRFADLL
jgi:hypothetical protein